MNAPCLNCERRTLGCHSTCEEYKKYDAENIKDRKKNLENQRLNEASINRFINRELYRKAAWQRGNRKGMRLYGKRDN